MSTARDKQKKAYAAVGIEPKGNKPIKTDKRNAYIKKQITEAFSNDAGIVALAYIARELCGYDKPDAVIKNQYGNIDIESTMYNAARRSVYVELRALLPREVIKQAEFYQLSKEDLEK